MICTFYYSLFFLSARGNLIFGNGVLKLFLLTSQLHSSLLVSICDIKTSSILQEELKRFDMASSCSKVKRSLEENEIMCISPRVVYIIHAKNTTIYNLYTVNSPQALNSTLTALGML